ncbi:hypothetical protein CH373_07475 [Leptospira perolatii]|uniref:Uncharacterized protein n=1 Tax=Leptospira perolatii TaxID=2023191 RepID=A0A2M9ZPR4_9LEPT|nr:hypothetical protein CH360_04335 [Leptospira perolatii]PJZ74067.1 hypothetical protein CH373_07475 [Leptospira perolatii]
MTWDTNTQDTVVYLIVGITCLRLLFPLVSSFSDLFRKNSEEETKFGCYDSACASCQTVPPVSKERRSDDPRKLLRKT